MPSVSGDADAADRLKVDPYRHVFASALFDSKRGTVGDVERAMACGISFDGNGQSALVSKELEGLKHTCCHWPVFLTTRGDHGRVRGAGRGGVL